MRCISVGVGGFSDRLLVIRVRVALDSVNQRSPDGQDNDCRNCE